MNDIQKALWLESIRSETAKDPSLCRPMIDAATDGVKDFSDNQNDIATKACFRLLCVLEEVEVPKSGKFGSFTVADVLSVLSGCFKGTLALARLREKFGVPADDGEKNSKPEDRP